MSQHASVLFVNEAFYEAFRDRDLDTMEQLWARRGPVACIHPGWQALTEREEILSSWRAILENPDAPAVHCRNAEAFVAGESAYVVCYEVVGRSVLVATNLFVAEEGQWRLIHHQAGPCDLPLDALDEAPEPGPMQ